MGPGRRFAARLILVIAVLTCVAGIGHLGAPAAPSAMGAEMTHAPAVHPHAASPHNGLAPTAHPHDRHAADHNGCCVATSVADAAVALPVQGVSVPPPASVLASRRTPEPPEPRPPDLRDLCVQRT
jgi:hypothetical protein